MQGRITRTTRHWTDWKIEHLAGERSTVSVSDKDSENNNDWFGNANANANGTDNIW